MKAIVLAAGEGRRLRPLTYTRPKCMIKVANIPIVEYAINSLKNAGIKDIVMVVGYKKEAVMEYFGDGKGFGVSIEYVEQSEAIGTANAVYVAKELAGDKFLSLNGDVLIDELYIKKFLEQTKDFDFAMAISQVDNPRDYGVVKTDSNSMVSQIVEKPEKNGNHNINAGIYLFNDSIFDAIERTERSERGEYELTDSLRILLKRESIRAVHVDGTWIDIGRPWDMLNANEILLSSIEEDIQGEIEKNCTIKGKIIVGKNSIIRSGAYIIGPVKIGENTTVGPNCFIRPSTTLGNNVVVGNAVEIKNSIIMDRTNVCHLSYVGDSIIGENCNIGAGTIAANLRHDNKNIMMRIKDELVDTGRRKFGVIMGDMSKTGVNVSINPGKRIGPHSLVGPGVIVYSDIKPNIIVTKVQDVHEKGV